MASNSGQFQDPRDLLGLKRSALHSHFRRRVDDLKDERGTFPMLRAFLPQNAWPWIRDYFRFAFNRKHPFLGYLNRGERGVYQLAAADNGKVVRVSLAADWGTGTREANEVAARMDELAPDYTIHLGDVYYVGGKDEVNENCLGQTENGNQGVTWPKGKVGSFALNGNHEMYANGDAYFDYFTRTLGIPSSQDHAQLASFFCLENDIWRIVGLDTGYNSAGLPILGAIPIIKKIPCVGANCRLEDELLEWLVTTVKIKDRPKATIILSHHQYFSAFDEAFRKPARQLQNLLGNQEVIWIWGHEHRFAVYEKYADGALTAYGRCIGNGGMPVEFAAPANKAKEALQFYDAREYAEYDGISVGFNGFVILTLSADVARFEYLDLTGKSLLQEEFTALAGGALSHRFLFVDSQLCRGSAAPETQVKIKAQA